MTTRNSKLRQTCATLLTGALFALSGPALAHRTYNVSGFDGTPVPDLAFSLGGGDGLGLPIPTYSGGSGPRDNTSGASFYNGALPVSWMAALHAPNNEPGEIFAMSTANALSLATTPADFVLAAGGTANGTSMDFGLIRVDNFHAGNGHGVRVTVTADASLGSTLKPYLALYSGWDDSWVGAGGTVKEDAVDSSTASRAAAYAAGNNPFGSDLTFLTEVQNLGGLDTATLFFESPFDCPGEACGHYTLLIGGVLNSSGAYKVTVETVPVPAAGLLFASALSGLGLREARRRRASRFAAA